MKPLAILFAVAVLAATAVAQKDPPRNPDKAQAPFVFEAGVVELRTLITKCGAYLQRNIILDENELNMRPSRPRGAPGAAGPAPQPAAEGPVGPFVELQLPIVTDRAGCEEMLANLLWARGLALVPLDEVRSVYEVIAMTGPRVREITSRAAIRTPEQVLARPALRQCVAVAVPLKHLNANIAMNAVKPFFASPGAPAYGIWLTIGSVGADNSVFLLGSQDQIAVAIQLIRVADVPQPPPVWPEMTQRIDALVKQNAELQQRVAALEEKLKQKG